MKIEHNFLKVRDLTKIRKNIHLNPAWQRGPVWSLQKKALLIDSILRGYDVPMIYLRECNPEATYRYEVVDGQQRLISIWSFIDGDYELSKNLEKIDNIEIEKKKYNDLPSTLKIRLNKFKFVIAYVKNAREPEISRLFSRMQMGVRLTPAELRNAVQTGLRHAIDATARSHPFFENSRITPARYKYQDYLAHAVSICIHDAKRDLKAQQLMEDYINIPDNIYAPVISVAYDILDFLKIINDTTSKRITQKWIFVDLFFLLFQSKNKLKKINTNEFSKTYLHFDKERLKNNAEPEKLISDKTNKEYQDLYDYIMAFKISGGEYKNFNNRNKVLKRRFNNTLEV